MSISSWKRGMKGQLLFSALLPVISFAIIFFVISSSIGKLNNSISVAHNVLIPNYEAIGEMRSERLIFNYQIVSAIVYPEHSAPYLVKAEEAYEKYKLAYKNYEEHLNITGESEIHEAYSEKIEKLESEMSQILSLLKSTSKMDKEKGSRLFEDEMMPLADDIESNFTYKVFELYKKSSSSEREIAVSTVSNSKFLLIAIILFSSLLVFAVLMIISSKISNSIIGLSTQLEESSGQVARSVEQLNTAGSSLSQSSSQAASSLQQTVASLEELSSTVEMNSNNAQKAAELSGTSRVSAEAGQQEILKLIESMKSISDSSKKIEEIISVIDDIAFQTNLLALNAAVEAARAGEQGKGFAVVADAVRTLAQRSASSAKDISTLIQDSVSKIQEGSQIADESGLVLSKIVDSIKQVADLNTEISTASTEQSTGIKQISMAMNQLDQAVQSNASSADEISATSGEINNLAMNTNEITIHLNEIVRGRN